MRRPNVYGEAVHGVATGRDFGDCSRDQCLPRPAQCRSEPFLWVEPVDDILAAVERLCTWFRTSGCLPERIAIR
jgi:hypothetical protein